LYLTYDYLISVTPGALYDAITVTRSNTFRDGALHQ